MSATVDAGPATGPAPRPHGRTIPPRPRRSPRIPVDGHTRGVLRSAPWLGVVLVVTAVVMTLTLGGTTSRLPEEAATTARAWSLTHLPGVVPPAWSGQPPLGWVQLGLWSRLTGAFTRYDLAVDAAREAMVVAALAGTALVFWVSRRLRLARGAAALASALFALGPLALVEHRLVLTENIATAWLLLAVVCATMRSHRVAAAAASAGCLSVAVLTHPAFLVAGVLPLWLLLRGDTGAGRPPRPRDGAGGDVGATVRLPAMLAGAAVLVAVVGGYLAVAALAGALTPPAGTPAPGAARPFGAALAGWWALDPVALTVGALAVVGGIFHPRIRPVAVTALLLVACLLIPGLDVPAAAIVVLLPLGAMTVAGVAESIAVASVLSLRRRRVARRAQGVLGVVVLVVPVVLAVPLWADRWATAVAVDPDVALRQAQRWVVDNVGRDQRVVADDAVWIALHGAGFTPDRLLRYGPTDGRTPAVDPAPESWRTVGYIVADAALRDLAGRSGAVATALENATVVSSFGSGEARVEVLRTGGASDTDPATRPAQDRPPVAQPVDPAQQRARAAVGAELAANPSLVLTDESRRALTAGQVDARVMLILAQRVATTPLTVAAFPADPGTDGADRRTVLVSALDGRPATPGSAPAREVMAWTSTLTGPFTPRSVASSPRGVLISYAPGEPAHLLDPILSKGN